MHGSALARAQRARGRAAGCLRTRTLKNWLSGYGTAGRGTHPDRYPRLRRSRSNDSWRWCFINWARAGLRHNHARRRRLRRSGHNRSSGARWGRGGGRCNRRRGGRGRGCGGRRGRCWTRRRDHRRRGWSHRCCSHYCGTLCGRSYHCRARRGRRGTWSRSGGRGRGGRRRCWPYRRRRNRGLCNNRRRHGTRRRSDCFLLLRNCLQHISGAGDVRQIDLGLDFFFAAQRTRGAGRRGLCFGRAANVLTHLFRFVFLERTGMGLLLSHSDER